MLGFQTTFLVALASFALPSLVSAHTPGSGKRFHRVRRGAHPIIVNRPTNTTVATTIVKRAAEFDALFEGNKNFKATVEPGTLKKLTDDGQAPPFMFIGCSDSRVSEGTVFGAAPGTLFTERNIANQFTELDSNSNAVLSYAVDELGVKHVIVMGHYGCGGVAAAIATPPEGVLEAGGAAIQSWIAPIRQLYESSTRPEIVALREANKAKPVVEEPEVHEPGFRALVEENVKSSVSHIAAAAAMNNHFVHVSQRKTSGVTARAEGAAVQDVFVHGFVYNIENGEIVNLGVSVGPTGVPVPEIPFPAVQKAGVNIVVLENAASAEPHVAESKKRSACESECKGKRGFFGW